MGNHGKGDSKSWVIIVMGIQNHGESKSWGIKILVPSLPVNGYKPLKPVINKTVVCCLQGQFHAITFYFLGAPPQNWKKCQNLSKHI